MIWGKFSEQIQPHWEQHEEVIRFPKDSNGRDNQTADTLVTLAESLDGFIVLQFGVNDPSLS